MATTYTIHTDVKYSPLELVDVGGLQRETKERWFNQTLCEVNIVLLHRSRRTHGGACAAAGLHGAERRRASHAGAAAQRGADDRRERRGADRRLARSPVDQRAGELWGIFER